MKAHLPLRVPSAGAVAAVVALLQPSQLAAEPHERAAERYPLTRIVDAEPEAHAAGVSTTPPRQRSLTSVVVSAPPEKIDPFVAVVSIEFGAEVRTIGDATELMAGPIGYDVVREGPGVSPLLEGLLDAPLPRMQREWDRVQVREILRGLAGVGHVLVADHVHRLITFDPLPRYAAIGQVSRARAPGVQFLVPAPLPDEEAGQGGEWQEVPTEPVESARSDARAASPRPPTAPEPTAPGDRFAARIDDVLTSKVPAESTSRLSATIAVRDDAERLTVAHERRMRWIAGGYENEGGRVLIRDCTERRVRGSKARALIGSSMMRLGVPAERIGDAECDGGAPALKGRTTHVLELIADPQAKGDA